MDNREFLFSLAIENIQRMSQHFSDTFKVKPEIHVLEEKVLTLEELKGIILYDGINPVKLTNICTFYLRLAEGFVDMHFNIDGIGAEETQAECNGGVLLKVGNAPNPSWEIPFKIKAKVIPEVYEVEPETETIRGLTAHSPKEVADWFVGRIYSLVRMVK
ncbi:hypothetical protein JXI42_09700 [bacterium]|nr:hypothetical protein [bacterium]